MTFKLIAPKAIRAQLSKAVTMKREVTISALFHGMVSSNVAFAFDMKREDAADFDTVLRELLPISFDKKMNGYKFDDKKAFKSAEKLGLELAAMRDLYKNNTEGRGGVVDAFYDAVMAFYNQNAASKKKADLSADDKRMNALSKIKSGVKAAKDNGATDRDIVDMLLAMGVDVSGALVVLPVAA